ncbi:3-isopropylmalate dehydrogenase [bacterium HR19]|nr:3-isopropylmalate dehydrogenase [bacterium HR19]
MFNILLLPGDGIGPEVVKEAVKILEFVFDRKGVIVDFHEELIGGCSIDKYGVPLRDEVVEKAKGSSAVFLGAVGGPKWDNLPVDKRPEAGLLKIRRELKLWANIRPIKVFKSLHHISPLKKDVIDGVDMVILRELTSDVYFGEPRGEFGDHAKNTMIYYKEEVERIAHLGFKIALSRKKKLVSVDKSNVLEVSAFWRKVVSEVSRNYPEVELTHIYVDAMSYYLILNPKRFDVVLCPNLFGDILSDEAGGIIGSLGLCPSASLGDELDKGKIFGLYEPVHGSAPDIAGKGIANPIATILSASLMLNYSFGMAEEAKLIEKAVEKVLEDGIRTPDIAEKKPKKKIRVVGTEEFGNCVLKKLQRLMNK